jgi:hypothetical protein
MQPLLAEYLQGNLESKGDAQWAALSVLNQLEIPVTLRMVLPTGQLSPSNINVAPDVRGLFVVPVNWYLLVTSLDGSILCVLEPPGIEARPPVVVSTLDISLPGDVGTIPEPTETFPVPPDTPSILVGGSQVLKTDGTPACYAVRSQYWKRSGESITIVAGEKLITGHVDVGDDPDQLGLRDGRQVPVHVGVGVVGAGIDLDQRQPQLIDDRHPPVRGHRAADPLRDPRVHRPVDGIDDDHPLAALRHGDALRHQPRPAIAGNHRPAAGGGALLRQAAPRGGRRRRCVGPPRRHAQQPSQRSRPPAPSRRPGLMT